MFSVAPYGDGSNAAADCVGCDEEILLAQTDGEHDGPGEQVFAIAIKAKFANRFFWVEHRYTHTATCTAGGCSGESCDYWEDVSSSYTCSVLESGYGCDCDGCGCGNAPHEHVALVYCTSQRARARVSMAGRREIRRTRSASGGDTRTHAGADYDLSSGTTGTVSNTVLADCNPSTSGSEYAFQDAGA